MKKAESQKYLNLIFSAAILLIIAACSTVPGTNINDGLSRIKFSSSDTLLVNIFNWAMMKSDSYVGKSIDPVGPWYEAALPGREAFCIRDVSHQCIAAEILGYSRQNKNMLRKFAGNISEKKDWCSYWEINRFDKPAPVDYSSDNDFWYNLNANFDIIDACYKLFLWTGDTSYIFNETFDSFFRHSLNEYIRRWQLQPDSIMSRPSRMNMKPETIKYRYARGIPSYDESQDDISVSGDLVGMICNAFRVYSEVLKLKGNNDQSEIYRKKGEQYSHLLDSLWWDKKSEEYHGFFKTDNKFYPGGAGQSEFLLWYNVVSEPERIKRSLMSLENSQVEVLSYLPVLFYRYGHNSEAYGFLEKIYRDKRRDYPEASSGAIEGIVRGLMGIEPSAAEKRIITCPRFTNNITWAKAENIPLFSGLISVSHESQFKTIFENNTRANVTWRATFNGTFEEIELDGKAITADHFTDPVGGNFTYTDIKIKPGTRTVASAKI